MANLKRTSSETRTQAQQERILVAAQKCFVAHGFHAASMASIAETAGMSPGLIYRYFENKSAIILAIIERHLDDARADIATLQSDTDLVPLFIDLFTQWQSGDAELMSPALSLEMTAEATRDPQIAKALAAADRVTGSDLNGWLKDAARSEGYEPADSDIRARAFVLRCVLGGLAIRAIREPDLDRSVLKDGLQRVLSKVMSFHNG
ncbi:MAG: TetR/AcrR family transcriptional regulator [Woeseiaceae bacterium]